METALPVVCLFGPTGVGKTELLEKLFLNEGELISADSLQVYKGLDIGTAKPDPAYMKKLPHHLIDICDYTSQFSTGDFVNLADKAVYDIHSRGLLPVISGGTAFYFRNFLFGLPQLPTIPPHIRQALNEELAEKGLKALRAELEDLDPLAAEAVAPQDSYRNIRALEVFRTTGQSIRNFQVPQSPRSEFNCLMIGLERSREELYERIDRRVEIMFEQGLVNEIFTLIKNGASLDDSGMKGIGYSEFFSLFQSGCMTLEGVKEQIQRNSRRYAKRQFTFFRSLPDVHWFHPDKIESIQALIGEFRKSST